MLRYAGSHPVCAAFLCLAFVCANNPAAAQTTPQPRASVAPATTPGPLYARPADALPPPRQPNVLPPVPNVAPGYAAPDLAVPSGDIVGVTQQPFVGISLSDAIGMALARNPELAVAQANRRIANYQIEAARGAYDVRLNVAPSFTHSVQPPQNAFFSGPNFGPIVENQSGVSGGLSGVTPRGQQYSITASGSRVQNNTSINTFDPTYPTALSVNLLQPLGRGRDVNDSQRVLQLATIGAQTSGAQTLLSASQTIASVQDAYWDLVAAWRNVAIQEEGLREARLLAASNQRLARQGVNAPIEVVQSNTQINVFQDNVFSAIQNVERLQNQLKSLIVGNPSDPIWMANLVPTSPVLQLPPEPLLLSAVARALANRPEMEQLRGARRSADVNLAYARDQLKPQIDLELGFTSNGFAGQLVPPENSAFNASSIQQVMTINQLVAFANQQLPPNRQIPFVTPAPQTPPGYLVGGLSRSVDNLATLKFPTYQAAVRFSLPLRNRTAKANYAIAQEQVRETEYNEISLIQRITSEARNALQGYRTARYRLVAARAARIASEQVLASEKRRFRAGASTTFLVLQRQLDLANNRGRELQAQTDLNKAVVELQRAMGATLQENHVDVITLQQGPAAP